MSKTWTPPSFSGQNIDLVNELTGAALPPTAAGKQWTIIVKEGNAINVYSWASLRLIGAEFLTSYNKLTRGKDSQRLHPRLHLINHSDPSSRTSYLMI